MICSNHKLASQSLSLYNNPPFEEITIDEFERLVDVVETDYRAIVNDMENKEMSELLLSYINQSKTD